MLKASNTNHVWRNLSHTVAPHYIKQNVEKLHSWIQSEYYEWSFINPMVLLIKIGSLKVWLGAILRYIKIEFLNGNLCEI